MHTIKLDSQNLTKADKIEPSLMTEGQQINRDPTNGAKAQGFPTILKERRKRTR